MIYGLIRSALLTFETLTALVGRNDQFDAVEDQYAIRPGRLRERDPLPGVVFSLPTMEIDGELATAGGFAVATLEVAAVSLDLDVAWEVAKAFCWNGGDPDDAERILSGLDGYSNLSGNGLQAIRLKNFVEDQLEPADKSDRLLWVVQGTFEVHFDVAVIVNGA